MKLISIIRSIPGHLLHTPMRSMKTAMFDRRRGICYNENIKKGLPIDGQP